MMAVRRGNKLDHDHVLAGGVQLCPHCGHGVTHGGGDERPPKPDDWCVCINCAAVSVFGRDLRLRLPNAAEVTEYNDMPSDHELKRCQVAVVLANVAAGSRKPQRPN